MWKEPQLFVGRFMSDICSFVFFSKYSFRYTWNYLLILSNVNLMIVFSHDHGTMYSLITKQINCSLFIFQLYKFHKHLHCQKTHFFFIYKLSDDWIIEIFLLRKKCRRLIEPNMNEHQLLLILFLDIFAHGSFNDFQ